MSPVRTVTHVTPQEMIAKQREIITGLEVENDQLVFVASRCRFVDESPPVCDICQNEMNGVGDYAKCDTCARVYQRVVEWHTIATVEP